MISDPLIDEISRTSFSTVAVRVPTRHAAAGFHADELHSPSCRRGRDGDEWDLRRHAYISTHPYPKQVAFAVRLQKIYAIFDR
jgi:hypothetical protein